MGRKIYYPKFEDLLSAMLVGKAPEEVKDTAREQAKKVVEDEAKKASRNMAERMLGKLRTETNNFYTSVSGLLKAIQIELGDSKWTWPAAENKAAWTEAYRLAKAHAAKNTEQEQLPQ